MNVKFFRKYKQVLNNGGSCEAQDIRKVSALCLPKQSRSGNVGAFPHGDAPTLIESTRAIGYSLDAAIADIIDNSIATNARNVDLFFYPVRKVLGAPLRELFSRNALLQSYPGKECTGWTQHHVFI